MSTADELRNLPWKDLVIESKSLCCEDLHKTMVQWITGGESSSLWKKIEPLFALFIMLDLDAETPLFPQDYLSRVPADTLTALVEIADETESIDAVARILDAAWQRRVCDHTQVPNAVAAYIESASLCFDPDRWLRCFARLKRAVELAASVGLGKQAFKDAVAAVEKTIVQAGIDDPLWLVHRLMTLLFQYRAGELKLHADMAHEMASKARQNYEANGVEMGLHCERERGYLELEIRMRRGLKEGEKIHALELELAEAFVRQADGVVKAGWQSAHGVAEHFVECAIKRLRQTGGESERVEELRSKREAFQRQAVAVMKPFEFSVNVSEIVKCAKGEVANKSPLQALYALIGLHIPPTLEDLEEEVRLQSKDSPFRALIPQVYLGPRGTALAHHDGILDSDDPTGMELETLRIAHQRQSDLGGVALYAAAEQVRFEHGLDFHYFYQLCHASIFVPQGREVSFSRALAAGMRGDYELAASLLFPQIEHAIREIFFREGIFTTTSPSNGKQNEHDLNRLLRHDRVAEIFGARLAYDLRVLLIEKAGGNLRNDLAHGILDDNAKFGAKVYFWWISLFLILRPLRVEKSTQEPTEVEPEDRISEDVGGGRSNPPDKEE